MIQLKVSLQELHMLVQMMDMYEATAKAHVESPANQILPGSIQHRDYLLAISIHSKVRARFKKTLDLVTKIELPLPPMPPNQSN